MIDTVLLFVIVFMSLLIGAIIVGICLAWHFAKAPSIDLVQGKLKNESDIDIEDAIPYLKLTNLE